MVGQAARHAFRNVEDALTQAQHQLADYSKHLATQGTSQSIQRLQAINQTLNGAGSAPEDLSAMSLASSNRSLARALVDSARVSHSRVRTAEVSDSLRHALRIARGEILVPELTPDQRSQLISSFARDFRVTSSGLSDRKNPVLFSFDLPAGKSLPAICSDLVIGCKAVQRHCQALELSNLNWIERSGQTVVTPDRSVRIEVGQRLVHASNEPFEQQKLQAEKNGMSLPSREVAMIMHSLAYLLTGKSLFAGFSAKLNNRAAVAFSDRGLVFEFGQKVNMFSQVFPVREAVI